MSGSPVQRKVGAEIEVVHLSINEEEDPENEDRTVRALVKGEVLHQGDGWKLTPDGKHGNSWVAEYIIAAVDETNDIETLLGRVRSVVEHAGAQLQDPARWSNGQHLEAEETGDGLLGSFHITGGLRLSRISELIKILYHHQEAPAPDKALATRAQAISMSGDNYKSVVALVAMQITDLASNLRPAGRSAKLGVSMLSRTDLGAVVKKVTKLTTKRGFINDVLTTAAVGGGTPLFANALPAGGARSIDAQQNLTAQQWIEKLLTGTDFVWSETVNDEGQAFGYDKVGPSTLGHRADGVVLELRTMQEQGAHSAPVEEWEDVVNKYARLFRALNAKESTESIIRAFYGEEEPEE